MHCPRVRNKRFELRLTDVGLFFGFAIFAGILESACFATKQSHLNSLSL
jgi:hypothetical protein